MVNTVTSTSRNEIIALHSVQRNAAQTMYALFKPVYDTFLEPQFTRVLPNHTRNVGSIDAIMKSTIDEELRKGTRDRLATVTGFAHVIKNPRQNSLYCISSQWHPKRKILFE
jgi:hypothetical protein